MTKLRRTISFLLIASLMILTCSCSQPSGNIEPTDNAGMAAETEQPIQPTAVAGNVPFVDSEGYVEFGVNDDLSKLAQMEAVNVKIDVSSKNLDAFKTAVLPDGCEMLDLVFAPEGTDNSLDMSDLTASDSLITINITVSNCGKLVMPDAKNTGTLNVSGNFDELDASGLSALDLLNIDGDSCGKLTLPPSVTNIITSCALDISMLSGLSALERLSISGSTDLSPLSEISSVKYLTLRGGGWDLAPLAESGIISLNINQSEGIDIADINKLTKLETLQLSDNVNGDISPILAHPSLKRLLIYVADTENNQRSILSLAFGTPINKENISLLDGDIDCAISVDDLRAFINNGGELYFLRDITRLWGLS